MNYPTTQRAEQAATRSMKFDVLDSQGDLIHRGVFLPSVGVSVGMEDGEERSEVEKAVRFLHAERAAVSALLTNGLTVVRA